LGHHDGEADISTLGILVTDLTGEVTTGVRAVSIPGLEGVEVEFRARGRRVPGAVDLNLGIVVPESVIVLSVSAVEACGEAGSLERGESHSSGSESCEDNSLHLLKENKKEVRKLIWKISGGADVKSCP
jgi:hypothetical protein